jgi:methionyl-tRNA formyltransferase
MDHGPLLAQLPMQIAPENWPISGPELDVALAFMGGALLADTLPKYLSGEITPTEQDHTKATYCSKLSKVDSEIALDPYQLPTGTEAREAWRKYHAFTGIGDTFFVYNGKRIKIIEAKVENDTFIPVTVIPEGKKSIDFTLWL